MFVLEHTFLHEGFWQIQTDYVFQVKLPSDYVPLGLFTGSSMSWKDLHSCSHAVIRSESCGCAVLHFITQNAEAVVRVCGVKVKVQI